MNLANEECPSQEIGTVLKEVEGLVSAYNTTGRATCHLARYCGYRTGLYPQKAPSEEYCAARVARPNGRSMRHTFSWFASKPTANPGSTKRTLGLVTRHVDCIAFHIR
jgi:hypothetical protein